MPDMFPQYPVPSSISAPAYIDTALRFQADSGYMIQRPRTSRPRRRYTVSYLGKRTDELHAVVDFLLTHRLGLTTFSWVHTTGYETVSLSNTTPVIATYSTLHAFITGFWVWIAGTVPDAGLDGAGYRVTRLNNLQVALDGSVAQGSVLSAFVAPYIHYATCRLSEDTWDNVQKLMGPEVGTQGRWTIQLVVEELF